MKKSLLLSCAACIALSSLAANPRTFKTPGQMKIKERSDVRGFGNFKVKENTSTAKKAPSKAFSGDDVITSVDGDVQDLVIVGSGLYDYEGMALAYYENDEWASNCVYTDNNEVYIHNLLPNFPVNSYVKGIKQDDKIVIDFPQVVYWEDAYQDGYYLALYKYEEFEEEGEDGNMYPTWDYVLSEETSLTLDIEEDGTMVAKGLSEHGLVLGAGFCSDDYWGYYAAWDLSIRPFHEKAVEAPDDIEVVKDFWVYKSNELGYGWAFNWAQGGDEIYFQGMSPEMPEAWIKATVEYGETEACLSIAQDQYLGEIGGYYIYTKCVKIVEDKYGDEDFQILPSDYQYQLVWDYEENTMVPKDPEVFLLLNTSKTTVFYLDWLYDFVIQHQESFEGTPTNPYKLEYIDFMQDFGEVQLAFEAPAFSTDGNVLLTDNLSYVIYIDDEEWTFDAEEYDLDEDLVEIPWNLYSPYIAGYGSQHVVVFFVEGISTLGVQCIYRYEGEETRSEIVTLNVDDPTSVAAVGTDKKVVGVKYYDVAGREVANPACGLVIKHVEYEDGSVASFKKIVR